MYIKFSSIFDAANYKTRIMAHVLVAGKSQSPFTIPKSIRIECGKASDCPGCITPGSILQINADMDNVLQFVDVATKQYTNIVKDIINRHCKSITIEVMEVQNVERIFISAPAGRHREKSTSTHVAYFLGYGIDANYNYEISGCPTADPLNQESTIVIDHAKKLKKDIESFKLSKEMHEQLTVFNVKDNSVEEIFDHLNKLYNVYAHNITNIYGRTDLHIAIDLAYHTVISFKFGNEIVNKGWADVVVIGDGRTGKGFVAERLSKYYNVGEVASADNCSFAGLVAGLEQYRGHWTVSWGRIPLNDLGLVILDEASELGEDWTKLSRLRSEGIASVDKIIKQMTNARTRFIALTNPIKRKISSYSYGIQALADVIEAPEDIARFDYALVLSDTEVPTTEINQERPKVAEMYKQDAEQNLILWVWSRQQDEIEFTPKAVKTIYALATKISESYVSDIPLIQGSNVRIKLAKIAIAFAGRVYSNREEGRILLVDDVHVECAYVFLNMIYKKAASGYYTMSQLARSLSSNVNTEDIEAISKYINSFKNSNNDLCKCLLNNNIITVRDIAEHLNFAPEIATEIVSKLLKYNMIIKKFQNCYVKNKHFTDWLKDQVLKGGGDIK